MNVEIGTETPIFLFWEYLFQNFGILSLQCGRMHEIEPWTVAPWLLEFLTTGLNAKSKLHIIHTWLHLMHDYSPSHQLYCTVHVKYYVYIPH
jgi:hypothetical protein